MALLVEEAAFLKPLVKRLRYKQDKEGNIHICARYRCVAEMINLFDVSEIGIDKIEVDESLF